MKKHSIRSKLLVVFLVCIAMISQIVVPCAASTTTTIGTTSTSYSSRLYGGGKFTLSGWLYYSSNTSTSIKCEKLGVIVKNTGLYDVTTAVFNAYNGKGCGNNKDLTGDYYKDPSFGRVEPGEMVVHTTPAWYLATGVSSTYLKYGNSAIFEMAAGLSEYECAAHQIWCYSDLTFLRNP